METGLRSDRFSRTKKRPHKRVTLQVEQERLKDLPSGFGIVSIVNNHLADGADPTLLAEALQRQGRLVLGPENPSTLEVPIGGLRVLLVGAYFRLPRWRTSYRGKVSDAIERLLGDSKADRKAVVLHWGYEHVDVPGPFQRDLAKRLCDAGADIIIGHHPHVAQGWEEFEGKPVFYSLGNFNFWQFDVETTEANRRGYVVRWLPASEDWSVSPYRIDEDWLPVFGVDTCSDWDATSLEMLSKRIAKESDPRIWFTSHYSRWWRREFHYFCTAALGRFRARFLLKMLIWTILPMQIRFYFHILLHLPRALQTRVGAALGWSGEGFGS